MSILDTVQQFTSQLTYNGLILLAVLIGGPLAWAIHKLSNQEVRTAVYQWVFHKIMAVVVLYGCWKFLSTIGWEGAIEIVMAVMGYNRGEAVGTVIVLSIFTVIWVANMRWAMAARDVVNYQVAKAQVFSKTGKFIP